MFLASKYEEMYPPEISDFAYVTDRAYTTAEIREMEMQILRVLKFQLGRPLPLQFLRRASKIYEVRGGGFAAALKCFCCLTSPPPSPSAGDGGAAHPGQVPAGAHHGGLRDGPLPALHGGERRSVSHPEDPGRGRMGAYKLHIESRFDQVGGVLTCRGGAGSVPGRDPAALHGLHGREFDSCYGAHRQERGEGERGADQTHGECTGPPNTTCPPTDS